jgi:hypothetical protein
MTLKLAAGLLALLFALFMLARNGLLVLAALRGVEPGERRKGRAVIPILNVLLALAILVVAVKGLVGALIRR